MLGITRELDMKNAQYSVATRTMPEHGSDMAIKSVQETTTLPRAIGGKRLRRHTVQEKTPAPSFSSRGISGCIQLPSQWFPHGNSFSSRGISECIQQVIRKTT